MLKHDLKSYDADPLSYIENLKYSVAEKGHNQLHGPLIDSSNNAYENGYFQFRIEFPLEYPFKPHQFFFLTHICHPNVDSATGAACHDELLSSWTPQISIRQILSKMHAFLTEPDYKKFYNDEKVLGKDPQTARQCPTKTRHLIFIHHFFSVQNLSIHTLT